MIACVASLLVLFSSQQGEGAGRREGLREGESVRESTDAFPGAEPVDAQGQPTVWCVRIVDAVDRRPIAGALVQVPWHPREGVPETEVHFQCAGLADEDGWVRLPMQAVEGWRDYVFADAPGYAAKEHCMPGDEECMLQRGTSVPVQLVDYTGRPVPDARIELVLGCGHVPAQRTVVANRLGRATLPDIWPSRHEDLFITAPGCHISSRLSRTWRTGDPPVEIHVVPGISVTGRVIDAQGLPVAGVRIGARKHARWARTGLDGRFGIAGVVPWADIELDPPPQLGLAKGSFTAPPDGIERTLVLGQHDDGCAVQVQVRGDRGEPAAEVRIALVRTPDGFTATARTDDDGKAKLSVGQGHYRVLADGELGTWGRAEGVVDVRSGAEASARLTVERNPTVRVDASRVQGFLGLTTATAYRVLEPTEIDGTDVPVPKGERATFRISVREGGEWLVKFIEVPAPGSKVVLDGPPVTKLKARCVGPDGQAMPALLTVERELGTFDPRRGATDTQPTAEPVAETRLVGTVTWVARPQDKSLAPVRGDVRLSGNNEVDLGTVTFGKPREPDLRLELPPELQGKGGSISCRLARANGIVWSQIEDDVVATGLSQVAEGDRLLIQMEGALPFSFRAPGPPPFSVKWPTGSLKVVLRSDAGKSLANAVAIFDGHVMSTAFAEGSPLELRGVPPGVHSLVLADREHTAKIFRVLSRDGEARTLEVTLAPQDR